MCNLNCVEDGVLYGCGNNFESVLGETHSPKIEVPQALVLGQAIKKDVPSQVATSTSHCIAVTGIGQHEV